MKPLRHITGDGYVSRTKWVAPGRARCSCGKMAYSSRKVAKNTAALQSKATGETIEAYKCVRGGHCWHIGHPPGTKRERMEAATTYVGDDPAFRDVNPWEQAS